jgi:uncharacterized protein YbjT (DUF2867 family)
MAAPPRRALIAGATGLVGSRLLSRLLADSRYGQVHVIGRRTLPAAQRPAPAPDAGPSAPSRLVEHRVDFESPHRWEAVPAVDDLFLCLGTTIRKAGSQAAFRRIDFDAAVGIARAAHRAGAARCVAVSAVGAAPGSRVFYNRVKGEVEVALETIGFRSLTLIRPSLLDGERAESRPLERLALGALRPVAAWLPARWRPVSADAVAATMVDAAARGTPGCRVVESERIPPVAG